MQAVVDSDVLVDHLQGLPEAADELARYADCCISLISWVEVMVGAKNNAFEEQACRRFLASFRLLPISQAVAERAVRLRVTHRLKLPDAIIWASAQAEACLLVTRNTKDFPVGDPGVRFSYRV